MSFLLRLFQRLASPFRSLHAKHDLAGEIRAHLRMLEDRFLAEGMSPAEARYAAQRAFGIERAQAPPRDARPFRWADSSRLDLKLGARMLWKYPGLSLVGGIGLAAAIAISATAFAFIYPVVYSTVPIEEGDRVVAVENWNVGINNEERRSLHDLVEWRREVRSIEHLSAFRTIGRNLIIPGGANEPVPIAEMTASGFTVARVPPLLGRYLVEDDERAGARPVLVIGHAVWQSRFASDPSIVGRDVRLGNTMHTIVGVMPEGFLFPVNHHYWVPMRLDLSAHGRREGPAVFVFGRLAAGQEIADAQAELAGIGARAAAQYPETHAQLEPRVMNYAAPILDIQGTNAWVFASMQAAMSVLLLVVTVNLAILIYARTATRQGEIAVRTALGASRARIVGQLFLESLVLSAIAAAAGLLLSQVGLELGHGLMQLEGAMQPYWLNQGMTAPVYFYVIALTIVAAAITGVIPALRATGPKVQTTLRELGGTSGMRLGATWTALIITQVALTIVGLPMAVSIAWAEARSATTRPAFSAERFVVAPFRLDDDTPAEAFNHLRTGLIARVEAAPEVSDVTTALSVPGDEPPRRVEVDSVTLPGAEPQVFVNGVAEDFFAAFETPLLTGRLLTAADAATNAVLVNRSFVQRVLGGGEALGRRIRYRDDGESAGSQIRAVAWFEIVGVVGDQQVNSIDPSLVDPVVFHPLDTTTATISTLIVRLRSGDAATFATQLRAMLLALDPSARINPLPMIDTYRQMDLALRVAAIVVALIIVSVLLLSAAGIYALMSFTVSQRRKEIGIRAAMGADARQLLISIFARAAAQIGSGVAAGIVLAIMMDTVSNGEALGAAGLATVPVIAAMMAVVGLAAAFGPARRGLRVQPIEVLRDQ